MIVFFLLAQLDALGGLPGAGAPLLAAGVGVTDAKRIWHKLQVRARSVAGLHVLYLAAHISTPVH